VKWTPLLPILASLLLPLASYAAGGGGEEEHGAADFWFELANLVLLVVVLFLVARKPVSEYLASRRTQIAGDLESAEQELAAAESTLGEWSRREAGVDDEMTEIQRAARDAAKREAEGMQADAEVTASRIEASADEAVSSELRRAQSGLRREATDLAIQRAGELLRDQLTDQDQDRLVEEFVERIERGEAA